MVTVELDSHSGKVIVEIMHDGNLRGVNCDLGEAIAYDRSMVEFGEDYTHLVSFTDSWANEELRLQALLYYYEFGSEIESQRDMVLLAADFAQHAFPIYMKSRYAAQHVKGHFFIFKKFISGTLSIPEIKYVIDNLNEIISSIPLYKEDLAAAKAIKSFVSAVQALGVFVAGGPRVQTVPFLDSASYYAGLAAQHDSGHLAKTPEWVLAGAEERSWQIRRFVDCMEAVQSDKPWPQLSETE